MKANDVVVVLATISMYNIISCWRGIEKSWQQWVYV